MSHYRPRKHEFNPKKSHVDVIQERMHNFLDTVEKESPISATSLQLKLRLGDGQFERLTRKVKSLYSDVVEWHKKTSTWKHIPSDPNQPREKHVTSTSLGAIANE